MLPTAPSEKRQPIAKVGGDKIHLVDAISKVGRDASHGSHRRLRLWSVEVLTHHLQLCTLFLSDEAGD